MIDDDFEKQVKEKFHITCKRCGSENVSISFDSGSDGWAGCFDLHSIEDGDVGSGWSNRREFKTGLAFEIPIGYVMLIYGRSGLAFHDQIRLSNCVGVIDSDYRGEVSISLTIDNDKCVSLYECDRIAQAMIIPIPKVSFEVVQELSDTERGSCGFGSTGA